MATRSTLSQKVTKTGSSNRLLQTVIRLTVPMGLHSLLTARFLVPCEIRKLYSQSGGPFQFGELLYNAWRIFHTLPGEFLRNLRRNVCEKHLWVSQDQRGFCMIFWKKPSKIRVSHWSRNYRNLHVLGHGFLHNFHQTFPSPGEA